MKNQNNQNNTSKQMKHLHSIPDLEVIDLDHEEEGSSPQEDTCQDPDNADAESDIEYEEDYPTEDTEVPPRKKFRLNMHIVLLIAVVLFFGLIIYRFLNWGVKVDLDEIFKDGPGTYDNSMDEILPLLDADSNRVPTNYSDGLSIVLFGNAPFADDRGSEDSLASLIAKDTGATVYNCSISGSYLASEWSFFDPGERPMDAFTFYWMCSAATRNGTSHYFEQAVEALGDQAPPEATEVAQTLATLDFSTVDVIAVMYDATDYLMGHKMYSDENSTDITYFTGNLEAGIELLQNVYPHIRIIVLSPTYAFGIDDNGEYISSDIKRYESEFGKMDVLSTYVIKEYTSCASRGVTFVDNLYGTITEDNAKEFLTDNLHLNVKGRKKVAERFSYALHYYDEDKKTD